MKMSTLSRPSFWSTGKMTKIDLKQATKRRRNMSARNRCKKKSLPSLYKIKPFTLRSFLSSTIFTPNSTTKNSIARSKICLAMRITLNLFQLELNWTRDKSNLNNFSNNFCTSWKMPASRVHTWYSLTTWEPSTAKKSNNNSTKFISLISRKFLPKITVFWGSATNTAIFSCSFSNKSRTTSSIESKIEK